MAAIVHVKSIRMKLLKITALLWVMFALGASCTEEDTPDTCYRTGDLSGTWSGDLDILFIGGIMDGVDSVMYVSFTFRDDGTLISMEPSPDYISISGNLTVGNTGEITGTISTVHDTPFGQETTFMTWNGCNFTGADEIAVDMTWTWDNVDDPQDGSYIISGTLNR